MDTEDDPRLRGKVVVYRPESGWEDATDGELVFEDTYVFPRGFNRHGDAALGTLEVDDQGDFFGDEYLYLADRTLLELPFTPFGLNDSVHLVGADFSRGNTSRRAYRYSPESGAVDIHPDGYADSVAFDLQSDGSFLLQVRKGKRERNKHRWFFVGPDLERTKLTDWKKVRRLGAGLGCDRNPAPFLQVVAANSRREIAGRILCFSRREWLVHRPGEGFTLVRELLEEAGRGDLQVLGIRGLNERGQILVEVESEGRTTAVLLTPAE